MANITAKQRVVDRRLNSAASRSAVLHPAELRSFGVLSQWPTDSQASARHLGVTLTPFDPPIDDRSKADEIFRKAAADGLNGATALETPTYLAQRSRLSALLSGT